MAERILTYATPEIKDENERFVQNSTVIPLDNDQQFLIQEQPLILPSESSEALISLPYFDNSEYKYPYYVSHEGFIASPKKLGKHAWLVGGQENKIGEIPLNANTYLFDNVLIDPGSSEGIPYLLENLMQLGKDLKDVELVLLTHAHLDHMEAIDDLQMLGLIAPVVVPEKSVEIIRTADVQKIGGDIYQHGFTPFRIDGIATENISFNVPGYSIESRKSPGHAEDHVYYVFTDEEGNRSFVVGDLLLGGERKGWYDEQAWKRSLHDFASHVKDEDEILAGHHPTVLHKNEGMKRAINGFGQQHWDLIPGQPGMLMSPWPY